MGFLRRIKTSNKKPSKIISLKVSNIKNINVIVLRFHGNLFQFHPTF